MTRSRMYRRVRSGPGGAGVMGGMGSPRPGGGPPKIGRLPPATGDHAACTAATRIRTQVPVARGTGAEIGSCSQAAALPEGAPALAREIHAVACDRWDRGGSVLVFQNPGAWDAPSLGRIGR